MAEFPALPLWTDAYLADTAHLTNEEHGVYLRLLMFAWRTPNCSLPDDDRRLAIMVGVTPRKWQSLRPVMEAFWTIENGTWTQKRLTAERDFVEGRSRSGRAGAAARWGAKSLKNKDTNDATASPQHMPDRCETHGPIPIPIKERKPKGFPKKVGSRISQDWQMPVDWIEWALSEGMTRTAADREAARFKDYWLGKPGKDGIKLDWQATWRNWVRKAMQDARASDRAGKVEIGTRKVNARGETVEWEGDYRGWVRVYE